MSWTTSQLLFSVFFVSLVGSWHCGMMCSGFSTSISRSSTLRLVGYHFGRLLSYVGLGGAVGFVGEKMLTSHSILFKAFAILFGLFLFLLFIQSLKQNISSSLGAPLPFLKKGMLWAYRSPGSSFLLGFLSVFLPCGWLYGFLFAAAAAGSLEAGALTMLMFWLGGLPILIAVPIYFRSHLEKINGRYQRYFQSAIFLCAFVSWAGFWIHSSQ